MHFSPWAGTGKGKPSWDYDYEPPMMSKSKGKGKAFRGVRKLALVLLQPWMLVASRSRTVYLVS